MRGKFFTGVSDGRFAAIMDFNGGLSDDYTIKNMTDTQPTSKFAGVLTSRTKVSDFVEKRLMLQMPFDAAISYVHRLEDGSVEGVVHLAGYKVIFNLTEMHEWFHGHLTPKLPKDYGKLSRRDLAARAAANARKQQARYDKFGVEKYDGNGQPISNPKTENAAEPSR